MYKLIFFVPDDHLTSVKQAVFQAGAGQQGHYDQCAWQSKGQGQFRPLKGAKPHIGKVDELTLVDEWRVEVLLSKEKLACVLKALKTAHPYEHPAFDVVQLVNW